MAARKLNYYRWLWTCHARVISTVTQKGESRVYAHISIPSGAYGSTPKEKTVKSVDEGWIWIHELADAWAQRENVQWRS